MNPESELSACTWTMIWVVLPPRLNTWARKSDLKFTKFFQILNDLISINLSNYNNLNGFNACCNLHDICYNDCFSNKKECDTNFYDCLKIAVTNTNETDFKKSSI